MSTQPTPQQIAAANLIAVSGMNGHPIRSWDPVHQKFPPTTVYVTPVTPIPPPVTNYTVTFVNTQGQTYPTLSLAAGSTFVLPTAPTSWPVGEVFIDWGDGAHTYNPGNTYTMPAANVIMTAIFTTPVTPPPPPPPPPPVPSGFALPPVAAGFTRTQDLMNTTTLNPIWSGFYNGQSGAFYTGFFIGNHGVLKGDGWMRLLAYPDPVNIKNCWQYTPALAASVNQWGGAGIQTVTRWPVGTTITFWAKWDTYPGITAICLLMSDGWTAEMDLIEANVSSKGGPVTSYSVTYMTTQGQVKKQFNVTNTDFSKPHLYQLQWTATGQTLTCDGNVIVSFKAGDQGFFPITSPQFFAPQTQTGDPVQAPAVDPTITATNPVTMYLGPIAFDVPS
jgi:hypothetical protein